MFEFLYRCVSASEDRYQMKLVVFWFNISVLTLTGRFGNALLGAGAHSELERNGLANTR